MTGSGGMPSRDMEAFEIGLQEAMDSFKCEDDGKRKCVCRKK
ncbi:MAG: hypothetical protein WBJ82_07320 [Tepidanaerobacteraceae bacterium]|nr:hypothetical protein [Tepidanaerobacteraceae bacterium]